MRPKHVFAMFAPAAPVNPDGNSRAISRHPSGFPRRGAPGRDRAVASRHVAEGSRGDHVPVVAVSHGRQRRRSAGIAAPPRAARTLPLYPERYETYKAEWPRGERASAARRGGARQRPLTPSRGGAPRGRAQPRGCTVPVLARGAPGATCARGRSRGGVFDGDRTRWERPLCAARYFLQQIRAACSGNHIFCKGFGPLDHETVFFTL